MPAMPDRQLVAPMLAGIASRVTTTLTAIGEGKLAPGWRAMTKVQNATIQVRMP